MTDAIDWTGYIIADAAVMTGKPVIRGTRLTVEFLLDLLAAGWTEQAILENYPQLTREALQSVFAFAADRLRESDYDLLPTQIG